MTLTSMSCIWLRLRANMTASEFWLIGLREACCERSDGRREILGGGGIGLWVVLVAWYLRVSAVKVHRLVQQSLTSGVRKDVSLTMTPSKNRMSAL